MVRNYDYLDRELSRRHPVPTYKWDQCKETPLLGGVSPCGFCGVFYSWNANLPSSVSLLPYSGKVGKTIMNSSAKGSKALMPFFSTEQPLASKSCPTHILTAVVPKGRPQRPLIAVLPRSQAEEQQEIPGASLDWRFTSSPVGVVTITGVSLTQ